MQRTILLYDGTCLLCSGAVRFVAARDPQARVRFAPLQSGAAAELLARHGLLAQALDTLVLIEGERAYTRSTAVLRLLRGLRSPWRLLYGLVLVPRPLRDLAYAWVARHRYRWFGRREQCLPPTPDLRERFLA